jgi:hypothetical protein
MLHVLEPVFLRLTSISSWAIAEEMLKLTWSVLHMELVVADLEVWAASSVPLREPVEDEPDEEESLEGEPEEEEPEAELCPLVELPAAVDAGP